MTREKMFINLFFFFLLLQLIDGQGFSPNYNQYVIKKEVEFQQCEEIKLIQYSQQYFGNTIFAQDSSSQAWTRNLLITGWFMPRSYDQNKFKPFFQLVEYTNSISISVGYNTGQNQFFIDQNGQKQYKPSPFNLKNIWIYIHTEMEYDTLQMPNKLRSISRVYYNNQVIQLEKEHTISYTNKPFIKSQVGLTLGNPLNGESSCSINRNIVIYWSDNKFQFNNSLQDSLYYDISSGQTYLFQYFDFFYTQQNKSQLLSSGQNQNKILLSHSRADPSEIKTGEVISTDFINIDQESGIVLNFQAKLQNPLSNSETVLLSLNNEVFYLIIKFIGSDTVFLNLNGQTLSNIDLTKWNHFNLIIKNQIAPRIYLIIKDYESKVGSIALTDKLRVSQFVFGSTGNQQSVYLANIRIYKGNYLSQKGSCLLSVMQFNDQCLYCNTENLLNYSNMSCSPKQAGVLLKVDGVLNTNMLRKICNTGMLNDPLDPNNCICQKGFFLNLSQECVQCPKYCSECTVNTCVKDPQSNRDLLGKCPSTLFDDGYSCLSMGLDFPKKQNLVDQLYFSQNPNSSTQSFLPNCYSSGHWRNSNYILGNSILKIHSAVTAFISFGFLLTKQPNFNSQIFRYLTPTNEFKIHLIENSGVFQLKASILSGSFATFFINQNKEVWVGIYICSNTVVILVSSDGSTTIQTLPTALGFMSISIQVGTDNNSGSVGCITLSDTKPFQLIQNIPVPDDFRLLKELIRSDKQILGKFITNKSLKNYQQSQSNQLISMQQILDKIYFPNSLISFSNLKGYTFTNNYYGQIIQIQNINQHPLSFHFVIEVTEIHQQTPLLFYYMNEFQIKIFLIPHNTSDKIAIRICYKDDCQDSNYSFFYLNEVTFVLIVMKEIIPQTHPDILYHEYEVVCNYKRETLSFIADYQIIGDSIDNLMIGYFPQELDPYCYNMNNLNIIEGDGFFHYSYYLYDPCFAYMNVSDMKCLYLKQQYAYINNVIKSKEECQDQVNLSIVHYFYNKYTQTYIVTDFLKSKCKSIDYDETLNEIVCIDPDSPYKLCDKGYYRDSKMQKCLQCSEICEQCEDTSTNCTSCKNSSSQAPSCSCLLSSQFLNENFQCQECQSQCSSCIEKDDQCLSCSEKRINPPFCICDPSKYSLQNNKCVEIKCQQQCEECAINSSECTKCSQFRENPPFCDCIFGYEKQLDGSCQACIQGQYFDGTSQKCKTCQIGCNECSSQSCQQCIDPLILSINNTCECPDGQSLTVKKNNNGGVNSFFCIKSFNIIGITPILKNDHYDIILNFPITLQPIDFEQISYEKVFQFLFTELESSKYSLRNPRIISNQLIVTLKLFINIASVNGYLIILKNEVFKSESSEEVLSEKYLKQSLNFQIGPFFHTRDQASEDLDEATQKILESGYMKSDSMNFLQKIQFFFYLLNTLQPSALFLLLKAQYPSHLYKFYQIIGQSIYPYVPDYSSSLTKETFSILGYELHSEDVSLTKIKPFRKFGYSTSLLVNIPIIVIKYSIILFVWMAIKAIKFYYPIKINNKISKLQCFFIQRLQKENEINLLSLSIGILVQITDYESQEWISRMGFYTTIVMLHFLIYNFYFNYQVINNSDQNSELKNSYIQFTERLPEKNLSFYQRNYFLFQYTKKYIVIILVFVFYEYPILVCCFCSFIFFFSSILTIALKPYTNNLSRYLKVFGELMFSIIWLLHIVIIVEEKKLFHTNKLDDFSVDKYNKIGTTIMLMIFSYNFIYLIEFLYSLGKLIQEKIKEKLAQKKAPDEPIQLGDPLNLNNSDTFIITKIKIFESQPNNKNQEEEK